MNTVCAGLVANMTTASQGIYMFVDEESGSDSLCVIRAYLMYSGAGLIYHSILVQALHRLFITVFVNRRRLQSSFIFIPLSAIQWLVSFGFGLPILLSGRILSDSVDSICELSLLDWHGILYVAIWIYTLPLFLLSLIYWKIIVHVHRTTLTARQNLVTQHRFHKEMRTLVRISIPILTLLLLGSPYIGFFLYAQATQTIPIFSYHISVVFMTLGQSIVMLIALLLTKNVQMHLRAYLCRVNQVQPLVQFVNAQPHL
ncbi:unnamed protein product [Adineta steineri]|uniref:G-protein coupled receptors family 1 profile domain-containing protein n=1 Tax=Adineta steineri TaxID=433720 RepID=A0A813X873_9BILA|nr:unnamed protein product [Adineta steineri]CAF0867836.1 unnamed protein product [Adineta steineri]CAF3614383.1 unnamed protein product [Adineta steineri]CAF3896330.1 unnamed protein product [Adineta steineri]